MSRIIMGEGKHDAHFMCMGIHNCSAGSDIDWFLAESLDDGSNIIQEEEKAVRDFIYGRDADYLVKSEEGNSNLYRLFSYYCEEVLRDRMECTIVADLDGRSISDLIEDIDGKLDDYYHGQIKIDGYESIDSSSPLRLWTLDVKAGGHNISTSVPTLTFDDDLESAANINYSDNWHQRTIDINNYATSSQVEPLIRKSISIS